MKHYNIKIYGTVQGINFRSSAKRVAIKLELSGFVRNEPDGSVYVEAEGENDSLDRLVAWCRKGPLLAKVSKVEVEENSIRSYNTFEIETREKPINH